MEKKVELFLVWFAFVSFFKKLSKGCPQGRDRVMPGSLWICFQGHLPKCPFLVSLQTSLGDRKYLSSFLEIDLQYVRVHLRALGRSPVWWEATRQQMHHLREQKHWPAQKGHYEDNGQWRIITLRQTLQRRQPVRGISQYDSVVAHAT